MTLAFSKTWLGPKRTQAPHTFCFWCKDPVKSQCPDPKGSEIFRSCTRTKNVVVDSLPQCHDIVIVPVALYTNPKAREIRVHDITLKLPVAVHPRIERFGFDL